MLGLASGLETLPDGDEEYTFLTQGGNDDWLRPYIGRSRILALPPVTIQKRLRWRISQHPVVAWAWHHSPYIEGVTARLPRSDGTIERAGFDLMHFTFQSAFLTKVPSIYHPHDLQHVHLPQFFPRMDRQHRERWFGAFCRQARMVAVASDWVRNDVISHFHLPADKVAVVPLAPATLNYPEPTPEDLARIRAELRLPEAFILYPAQTWPHKNHLRLVEALALLRDQHGISVPLVCTGRRTEFHAEIDKRIRELRLESLVRFVDFVPAATLQGLYRMARAVVIPTLFEAGSFPMAEAMLAGTPAACSNVTSLPEEAGGAALIFDPLSVRDIADTIRRLWTDADLRQDLSIRGRQRIAQKTWHLTALKFRAHYRRLGGRPLTEEDHAALAARALAL